MADNRLNPKINVTRFGETLPLKLDRASIIRMAQAAAAGGQLGMPAIGKNELFNKIALEGREDAGTNEYNYNNPKAKAIYDAMAEMGFSRAEAMYPAAVFDKSQVAKRLGIPFEKAWNGTGRVLSDGTSAYVRPHGTVIADGERHTQRAEAMKGAKDDPRNKEAVDLISRAMSGDLTSQENLMVMNNITLLSALFGGPVNGTTESYPLSTTGWKYNIADASRSAAKLMKSTPAGKKAYEELLPEDADMTRADWYQFPDLYKYKSGIDVRLDREGKRLANSPVMDVILGVDPGAQKFLADAEKKYPAPPAPPSILDKILSFFN